jgi:uncharacterized membrane-anchored protein
MIFSFEDILSTGHEYKFRTQPIDPNDPFRGKYVSLSYKDENILVDNPKLFSQSESAYASIISDQNGFAKIEKLSMTELEGKDCVKLRISYINGNLVHVYYPFDKFYMDEFKAPEAETMYNRESRDTSQIVYSLVSIKNGKAVLKDVIIDGKSIKDWVKEKK